MEINKLVRDKIPELIEKEGAIPLLKILENDEYIKKLDDKLIEECHEVINAKDKEAVKEEIADTLEVLYTIARRFDLTASELEEARIQKHKKRGGFDNKLFLIGKNHREKIEDNQSFPLEQD